MRLLVTKLHRENADNHTRDKYTKTQHAHTSRTSEGIASNPIVVRDALTALDPTADILILCGVLDVQVIEIAIVGRVKGAGVPGLDHEEILQPCLGRAEALPRVLLLGAVELKRAVRSRTAAGLGPDVDLANMGNQ